MTAIEETQRGMIDLDNHGQAYMVGDVHGDPFAFTGPCFLPAASTYPIRDWPTVQSATEALP